MRDTRYTLRPEEFVCECGCKVFVDRYGDCGRIDFEYKWVHYHPAFLYELRRDEMMRWYCEECMARHPLSAEIQKVFDRWCMNPPFWLSLGGPGAASEGRHHE